MPIRFKFWRRPPKPAWALPQMDKFSIPEHIKIFLIGFSYDELTAQTFTWLCDILVSQKVNVDTVVRFSDDKSSTKEELTRALEDNTPRVELFCGHGFNNGLFGPPRAQAAGSILSDTSHVIYDMDMITITPSAMFAFCCQAAQNFGRVFTSYKDKQFMGFKDDIPFPKELYEDFKYVFQTVAKDIMQEGRISEKHRNMFLEKLDEVESQSGTYQNATLIEIWLGAYRKHLMTYL